MRRPTRSTASARRTSSPPLRAVALAFCNASEMSRRLLQLPVAGRVAGASAAGPLRRDDGAGAASAGPSERCSARHGGRQASARFSAAPTADTDQNRRLECQQRGRQDVAATAMLTWVTCLFLRFWSFSLKLSPVGLRQALIKSRRGARQTPNSWGKPSARKANDKTSWGVVPALPAGCARARQLILLRPSAPHGLSACGRGPAHAQRQQDRGQKGDSRSRGGRRPERARERVLEAGWRDAKWRTAADVRGGGSPRLAAAPGVAAPDLALEGDRREEPSSTAAADTLGST